MPSTTTMKSTWIATTCLILLVLVQETASSSFTRQQKLTEFEAKVHQKSLRGSRRLPRLQFLDSLTTKNVRVIYPIDYGADPSGGRESCEQILEALRDAFNVQNGSELLPGVNDLGGVLIDFQGGNFLIGKPIRFPASGGGNVVVRSGSLRASSMFPGDRHLIEMWSRQSKPFDEDVVTGHKSIFYEDITFEDILFDSSYRGGGLFIIDSARIRISNCFFLHFTTQGVLVRRGHETFITTSFLGQHSTVGGDPNEKYFSGTGIELASNDNTIRDVVIFSAAVGILLKGQANLVVGVHCYNKAAGFGGVGIFVKYGAALTRISSCYLDFTGIVMEDPVQVQVTNGLFFGDANVVLKSINGQISGVNVIDSMFHGNPEHNNPIVAIDGSFRSIDQVVIDRNSANGMRLKSTAAKLVVTGNGTKWVADFTPILVFPNQINHFQYSFYVQMPADGLVQHAITNVSDNKIVVQSNVAVTAAVSVAADQYNMNGESNLFA